MTVWSKDQLLDVVHDDGEQIRRLRDVTVDSEDDFFFAFRRRDESIIRLAKRLIRRIEPVRPRNGDGGGFHGRP